MLPYLYVSQADGRLSSFKVYRLWESLRLCCFTYERWDMSSINKRSTRAVATWKNQFCVQRVLNNLVFAKKCSATFSGGCGWHRGGFERFWGSDRSRLRSFHFDDCLVHLLELLKEAAVVAEGVHLPGLRLTGRQRWSRFRQRIFSFETPARTTYAHLEDLYGRKN